MKPPIFAGIGYLLAAPLAALLLSACASVNFDDSVKTVNQEQQAFTQSHLSLLRTDLNEMPRRMRA